MKGKSARKRGRGRVEVQNEPEESPPSFSAPPKAVIYIYKRYIQVDANSSKDLYPRV